MYQLEIAINNGVAELIGTLNRHSVATLKKKIHQKITEHDKITLNLAKVSEVDTAGLAWLLYLLELANKSNCHLSFADLPADLLKLAKLSAVDEFICSTSH